MNDDMKRIPDVGAQDPERRNSAIADERDEDMDVFRQEIPGEAVWYFKESAGNSHALL